MGGPPLLSACSLCEGEARAWEKLSAVYSSWTSLMCQGSSTNGGEIAQEKWQNFQPKLQSPHAQQRPNCHNSPCVKSLGGYDQVMQEEGEGL